MNTSPSGKAPPASTHHEEGYVMLPCNTDQFRDFIKGLLGSPQSIGKTIRGCFEVNMDDLKNLHFLVMQRVQQQNEAILIQFRAKVVYSDSSSVELSSPEELVTYNEIRPVVSTSVHLSWEFMIKFQDKAHPEKQRIQVSIIASEPVPSEFDSTEFGNQRVIVQERRKGLLSFRIEHTARTWGADIEAMLTNHLQTLCKNKSGFKKTVRNHSGKIALFTGALLFLAICLGVYLTLQAGAAQRLTDLKNFTASEDLLTRSNATLDYVARFVVTGVWSKQILAVMICIVGGFVASLVITIWVASTADRQPASFVLLTKEALKHKEEILGKEARTWGSFIASIVTAITTGSCSKVISTLILDKFFS